MNNKPYLRLIQSELKAKICMNDKILNDYIPSGTNRYKHILGVVRHMKHLLDRINIADKLKPLLIQAAYLHDIGYSNRLNATNFHPFDGAVFAQNHGFPKPVVAAVLFHSGACESAKKTGSDLVSVYELNTPLLDDTDWLFIDLVTYCDLHTAPTGENITFDERIQEIIQRYGESHEVSRFMVGNRKNFKKTIQRVEKQIIV
ncbi:MAG: HDIG domain-containing metalloprotein [Thermoactinomyces sp.]